jgi:hypothetical protein
MRSGRDKSIERFADMSDGMPVINTGQAFNPTKLLDAIIIPPISTPPITAIRTEVALPYMDESVDYLRQIGVRGIETSANPRTGNATIEFPANDDNRDALAKVKPDKPATVAYAQNIRPVSRRYVRSAKNENAPLIFTGNVTVNNGDLQIIIAAGTKNRDIFKTLLSNRGIDCPVETPYNNGTALQFIFKGEVVFQKLAEAGIALKR